MRNLIILSLLVLHGVFLNAQVFTTDMQKAEVKDKLNNGWNDPDGDFPDIPARVNSRAAAFLANPSAGRYTNAETSVPAQNNHPSQGNLAQALSFTYAPREDNVTEILYCFDAAKVGWANDDPQYANALFDELLWITQQAVFDFGDTARYPRAYYMDQFPTPLMGNYFRQWIVWYEDYIMHHETTSTAAERTQVNDWIADIGDWAYETTRHTIGLSLGTNWPSVANDAYSFTIGWSNTKVSRVYNSSGTILNDFVTSDGGAYNGNNRLWGIIGLAHVAAIYNKDQAKRNAIVQHFKNYFKWSIFPNGIPMEIDRNTDASEPSLFFGYFNEIMQGLSEIAFREESIKYNGFIDANGWAWESLFEFTTTQGFTTGQSIGNGQTWNAGPTTDGTTEKGLLLMANALVDFWTNEFDYYTSSGLRISGSDKRFVSALGIITTYHDDKRLKDASVLKNSAGMPTGAPATPAGMPSVSGVFGSINFPLAYIDLPNLFGNAAPQNTGVVIVRKIKMIR